MTKFEIGDKVRILDVSKIEYGAEYWSTGDITEVARIKPSRGVYLKVAVSEGDGLYVTSEELRYIEKVSQSPTKNQRLSALEQQVAELQAEVATLKSYPKPTEIAEMFALAQLKAQKPTLHIGKASVHITQETPKLSANEQRKAIIAEAKAFVADVEAQLAAAQADRTQGNYTYQEASGYAKYNVNAEKRTVVALVHSKYTDKVIEKAIAKCAPDDVFNADIGKAIALGRALGLDVERFEQAVKPTEVVVGMGVNVSTRLGDKDDARVFGIKYGAFGSPGLLVSHFYGSRSDGHTWVRPTHVTQITDDTDAQY